MPHDHPLHTELEVTCLCCGSLQPFTFTSTSDQLVCTHCRSHLGDEKAVRRDREHIALWASIWDAERRAHSADVVHAATDAADAASVRAALEAKVAELSATVIGQFDAAPASGVREELQSDLVRRAERATELANRRNDRTMAALWRLAGLHHGADAGAGAAVGGAGGGVVGTAAGTAAGGTGTRSGSGARGVARCACGKPITECPDYRVLASEEQVLREWEAKNAALLQAGVRHGLPEEHPAVIAASNASAASARDPRSADSVAGRGHGARPDRQQRPGRFDRR